MRILRLLNSYSNYSDVMELTIGRVLWIGIEFHKVGEVQKADSYYIIIQKTNPKHPNLGNLIEEDMMYT